MQDTLVRFLGQEYPMEEEMATQYSCLKNPMDGGAWWATVHGVAQSQTQLMRLSRSKRPYIFCSLLNLQISFLFLLFMIL